MSKLNDEQLASLFYSGGTPTAAPPAPSPPPTTELDDAAQTLFAPAPAEPVPMSRIAAGAIERAAIDAGALPDEAQQAAGEWVALLAQHDIVGRTAEQVVEAAISATVTPPDDTAVQAWVDTSLRDLRAEFGDNWRSALDDAKALIASDKRLFDYLDRTGFGNHPSIVRAAVARARALRSAGKPIR